MENLITLMSVIAILAFLIVVSPFILILGLNILGFEIPYNIASWAGSLLVTMALRSPSYSRRDR